MVRGNGKRGVVFALARGGFFWTSVFLFFGKWLGMSKALTGYAGTAFAYAVVLTIAGGLLLAKFDERRLDLKVEGKAYEFKGGADFGDVKLEGKGKAYPPVKFGRKRVGWVLDGEAMVKARTPPLGEITKKLLSPPVVVWTEENVAGKKVPADPAFVGER